MIRRREVLAWAFYDFANSAFATLVVTFVFSAYFANEVVGDPERGTILWTRAVNASAILVAIATPILGAMADVAGRKKQYLVVLTLVCVAATTMLFFATPGRIGFALVAFVIANFGFEASSVFYNAFLPEISTPRTIGRVSGFGWGLGYVGGLLCLAVALGMVGLPGHQGWLPDEGLLDQRSTMLLVACWYLVFAIPLLLFVREKAQRKAISALHAARAGCLQLVSTFTHLGRHRQATRLLVARLIYNDGLVTAFSMAAIFASVRFGMSPSEIIPMAISLNLAAGIGAFVFGFIDDRIGGKKTLIITLIVLVFATCLGAMAPDIRTFWLAAILISLMAGPNQSASRTLLCVFVPEKKQSEFFGFFAFSGKLASLLGPLTYGLVVQHTHSQQAAMGSISIFFIVGLFFLFRVDEAAGRLEGQPVEES